MLRCAYPTGRQPTLLARCRHYAQTECRLLPTPGRASSAHAGSRSPPPGLPAALIQDSYGVIFTRFHVDTRGREARREARPAGPCNNEAVPRHATARYSPLQRYSYSPRQLQPATVPMPAMPSYNVGAAVWPFGKRERRIAPVALNDVAVAVVVTRSRRAGSGAWHVAGPRCIRGRPAGSHVAVSGATLGRWSQPHLQSARSAQWQWTLVHLLITHALAQPGVLPAARRTDNAIS